ncbi:MAG: 2-haloacid dehalogenase [Paraglaciecola sp.]|jgi:2-haloacid dehalogenase
MNSENIQTIVFDLGGVLVDWSPDYVFKTLIPDKKKRKWFFDNICTSDWNEEQDAGRLISVATKELLAKHPEFEVEIEAFYGRWEEMLKGQIDGTVEILKELVEAKTHRILALTNWSAETFPVALRRFEFLQWFEGIVVSGTEMTRKPFADFYQILFDRYEIDPATAIFIDDNAKNILGSEAVGMRAIHFKNPGQLREELKRLEVF